MGTVRYRERETGSSGMVASLFCNFEYLWPSYFQENRVLYADKAYMSRSKEAILDQLNASHGGRYLEGGPLDLRRYSVKAEPVSVLGSSNVPGATRRWSVNGTVYPMFYGSPSLVLQSDGLPESGVDACSSYGAEAWNRFKPGKPQVGLSVFIAELRDLPKMLQLKAYQHRNLGKHYLEAQFGWLPFVSDLRRMYETQQNMGRILTNIQNMNGKWVGRSGSVLSDSNVHGQWSAQGNIPVFNPVPWGDVSDGSQLACEGYVETSERVWFSGRFRYYIPDIDRKMKDTHWRRNTIRKIYGLTITPADVWEAVPWSWLIDYFTNVGDILSNISNGYVDDVVAKYAYVMRSQQTKVVQKSSGRLKDPSQTRFSGYITATSETKARKAADPFGFAVSGDLSSRQLMILSALGLSRA